MKMLVIELKWCQVFCVLCDSRVPQKLKGKIYRTAIRLVICMEQNVGLLKDDIYNN
jgi:hypothetical protein